MEKMTQNTTNSADSGSKIASFKAKQQQQKNLKLIDGEMLSALMIKYEVGITTEDSIKIYRVDSSYFE